jgi:serine/threonine-protein kinase
MDGMSLRALLAGLGPELRLHRERLCLALVEVCRALEPLHAEGEAHLALCPEAIRIGGDGSVSLRPAPLAAADDPARAAYLAPEQLSLAGQRPDARADLFAVGAILYEILSGERAFPGETLAEVGLAVLEREPPLGGLAPDCPRELRGLCLGLLEKDREARRPAAARDAAAAIARALPGVAAAILPALTVSPLVPERRGGDPG